MGKLKIIKTGPLSTIQDTGRYGYRKYGIPQSGAMDVEMMEAVNNTLGNPKNYPVIEFAMMGLKLETLEPTNMAICGADLKRNGEQISMNALKLEQGDILETSAPHYVYAYLGLGGKIEAKEDFGSHSTYSPAGFGGFMGRELRMEDVITSCAEQNASFESKEVKRETEKTTAIRVLKGPELGILKDPIESKSFQIDASSNRMGIRLKGGHFDHNIREITSSPVIPGTIQLPPSGKPIVLMNDCQTTGGYPRIGKVIEGDLGKLAQIRPGNHIRFTISP